MSWSGISEWMANNDSEPEEDKGPIQKRVSERGEPDFRGYAGSAVFLDACSSTKTETTTQAFTKIVTSPPDTITVPTNSHTFPCNAYRDGASGHYHY